MERAANVLVEVELLIPEGFLAVQQLQTHVVVFVV